MTEENSFSGLQTQLQLRFNEKNIGNLELDTLYSLKEPFFRGANVTVSAPLICTTKHIFSGFFYNPVFWEISLKAGMTYRYEDNTFGGLLGISPFFFGTTKYTYEFLSPYVIYDLEKNLSWGVTVFKVSSYWGGAR